MPRATFYDILGIDPEASPEQIRRAYRAAARKLHPDTNASPDAEARFRELAGAYETLSDPAKRHAYDLALATPAAGAGPHFTWTNIADTGASVSWAEEERRRKETEFDEMYDAYFGVHEPSPKPRSRRARKSPPL
jgi:DnaJ-class molecular chaperone